MQDWKRFEEAVGAFVAALDPGAAVTPNASTPDIDTGRGRQRDVWVEASVCNYYKIRLLISCKRWRRKLNEQDLDAFLGELRSSGAHKGVIYSYSGFTKPALEKADAVGVSCCKLYQDEPADMPASLLIRYYCAIAEYRLKVQDCTPGYWQKSLADALAEVDNTGRSAGELLLSLFEEQEALALPPSGPVVSLPNPWIAGVRVGEPDGDGVTIGLQGTWRIYVGRLEANLLNGSYSFTDNAWIGQQHSPIVEVGAEHPGEGWELLDSPPEQTEPNAGVMMLMDANIGQRVMETLGQRPLGELVEQALQPDASRSVHEALE